VACCKKLYLTAKLNSLAVLGELENDPAERTVPSVDPANLNQVILAEGKQNANKHKQLSRLYKKYK
jgi:hypothetical protein